jgi:hypothetical protein
VIKPSLDFVSAVDELLEFMFEVISAAVREHRASDLNFSKSHVLLRIERIAFGSSRPLMFNRCSQSPQHRQRLLHAVRRQSLPSQAIDVCST